MELYTCGADSTNLPSILSTIAARRHSFFGHIRRLSANTPAHKALKLAVDSKSGDVPQHDWNRPAGRPRTTWMSQIVWDTGLTAVDAWALADDRSTWRVLRPMAGYAQQWVSEWCRTRNVETASAVQGNLSIKALVAVISSDVSSSNLTFSFLCLQWN